MDLIHTVGNGNPPPPPDGTTKKVPTKKGNGK